MSKMEKEQIKEMKELFRLAIKLLDNQIKYAKIMENSFKLQARQSEINKKQQERVLKQLENTFKESELE